MVSICLGPVGLPSRETDENGRHLLQGVGTQFINDLQKTIVEKTALSSSDFNEFPLLHSLPAHQLPLS